MDNLTVPVQFCRDNKIFDFKPIIENWDLVSTEQNSTWHRKNETAEQEGRIFKLEEIAKDNLVIPVPLLQFLPKKASLTRDIVGGISSLYLKERPEKDVLRGKLVRKIINEIGMTPGGRSYRDVENILITLSRYRIYNQTLWRYNPKTKATEPYKCQASFGFVDDYLKEPLGDREYEYSMRINRIYAELLENKFLPKANIPLSVLEDINKENSRNITPAKNIAYALAAQRNLPSVQYKTDTLNNIAGYGVEKPNKIRQRIVNLLDILQPNLIKDYKVKEDNNIIIDLIPVQKVK